LEEDIDNKSDFINANYVSGYNNEENAYIFTQGKTKPITINSERFLAYDMARKYFYYSHDN
ncbi:unnamed protein product, partial [Rotaria magnacalcarata]